VTRANKNANLHFYYVPAGMHVRIDNICLSTSDKDTVWNSGWPALKSRYFKALRNPPSFFLRLSAGFKVSRRRDRSQAGDRSLRSRHVHRKTREKEREICIYIYIVETKFVDYVMSTWRSDFNINRLKQMGSWQLTRLCDLHLSVSVFTKTCLIEQLSNSFHASAYRIFYHHFRDTIPSLSLSLSLPIIPSLFSSL